MKEHDQHFVNSSIIFKNVLLKKCILVEKRLGFEHMHFVKQQQQHPTMYLCKNLLHKISF